MVCTIFIPWYGNSQSERCTGCTARCRLDLKSEGKNVFAEVLFSVIGLGIKCVPKFRESVPLG